jgi:hypothetical protein
LLDLPLDALAHIDEGLRRLAHLAGAPRFEVADRPALAEFFGGLGQHQNRRDLISEEQQRNEDEDQRGPHHP